MLSILATHPAIIGPTVDRPHELHSEQRRPRLLSPEQREHRRLTDSSARQKAKLNRPKFICNQCGRKRYELIEQDDEFLCVNCINTKPDLTLEEIARAAAEIRAEREPGWVDEDDKGNSNNESQGEDLGPSLTRQRARRG